jgi:L-2-hydroxycarboxylate dehydrogenase (NAD+)
VVRVSHRQPAATLTGLAAAILGAVGVPPEHANITATRLVEADLRGRTGHGLIRLASYVSRIRAGGINVRPAIEVHHETAVSAQIDGDNGLGQVVMTRATELAIAKARESGLAWVGTVHCNHAGAAGLYAQLAADAGLVGIYSAVANANGMPPWGGTNPLLGTNPLAIAIPTNGSPFVLDIATTAASHGTIKVAAREGRSLPEGWLVDGRGQSITDPRRAADGFLVPMGGYKGSGLTIAIGLLAGVLNGAAFGAEVVDHRRDAVTPTNTGQAILVMRPDLFRPQGEVLADLTRHLDALRDSGTPDGRPVRLPGDESARVHAENIELGVPVADPLAAELHQLARDCGVASPFSQHFSKEETP